MDGFISAALSALSIQTDNMAVFWFVAGLSVFSVAVSKSGFGGAMGALAAPLMLTVLPAKTALAVLLPLFLATDFWTVYIWRGYSVKKLLGWMVVMGVIGQILGWMVISYIDDQTLKACIGGLALFMGVRYWYRVYKPAIGETAAHVKKAMRKRFRERAAIWCTLSGFSSFISLTGGIPVQVYMLPMAIHRFFFVGTLAWYFLLINLAKLPFFLDLELFTTGSLVTSALLLPIIPVGVIFGKWLVRRINDRIFYHIAHFFLIILGLRLVYTSL
jgi:uncharacterized membrane protein YfcA